MADKKVAMISSTIKDLPDHRQQVRDGFRRCRATTCYMAGLRLKELNYRNNFPGPVLDKALGESRPNRSETCQSRGRPISLLIRAMFEAPSSL